MGPFGCCEPKTRPRRAPPSPPPKQQSADNPTAAGAREDDVDDLVNEILKDPSINISLIPDAVERLVYKSTISLTLNAFYSIFQNLEGTKFMAHQIHLKIQRGNSDDATTDDTKCSARGIPSSSRSFLFSEITKNPNSNIDDKVLEDVAERLLANKAINQRFLPDQLEHLLYTNCLKVVFRILDILASSLRVTLCGHEIGLFLEPATWQSLLVRRDRSLSSSSSLSEIDEEKLHQFARHEAGITEKLGFWDSLFVPEAFLAQLHSSLYALILGIVDDMLANTKIEIMSDTISLDVVPSTDSKATNSIGDSCKVPASVDKSKDRQNAKRKIADQQQTCEERTSICNKLKDTGFDNERKIYMQRFQEMSPEERLVLARDLKAELPGQEATSNCIT